MSRYTARIRQLERQLRPVPTVGPVTFLVLLGGEPPEWAQAALEPYLPTDGVRMVTWHQAKGGGELTAEVEGRWYSVGEAGVQRIAPPFTFHLDDPNGAGGQPMTPRQAHDILRSAEEDGYIAPDPWPIPGEFTPRPPLDNNVRAESHSKLRTGGGSTPEELRQQLRGAGL